MPRRVRERFKRLAAWLLRPGLADIEASLERLEQSLETIAGGIHAREKHREELAYWRWLLKTPEGRTSLSQPPQELFAHWQRQRLRELGDAAGITADGNSADHAVNAWCETLFAIEIGAGPYPALAAAPRWRCAVAVDPLARSYAEEGMLPPAANNLVYIEAPGERIPLPSDCADLIIIENALDHVGDPAAVMTEIRRLLRADGLLWVLVDLSNHSDRTHPHAFDVAALRHLLTHAGFEPISEGTSDHKSHPKAYGEYRGLLRKIQRPTPTPALPPTAPSALAL